MSTGLPELGSKISLISKADIRYEGQLFTVDPQECTIALASVRSFGTEDRETQCPVAPQNQVYDYILFRGSDIKDIRVVNNVSAIPNDPAIMQLSVPPSSFGQQGFQAQGFRHPVLGPMAPQMGPQMGQFANPYGGMGHLAGMPSGLAPGMSISRDPRDLTKALSSELITSPLSGSVLQPDHSGLTDQSVNNDYIGANSRSTTPVSQKSQTAEQSAQTVRKDAKTSPMVVQPPNQQKNIIQNRNRKDNNKVDNSLERRQNQNQNQNQMRGQQMPRSQHSQPMQQHQQHQQQHHNQQHQQQHNQQGQGQLMHQAQNRGSPWNRGGNMRMRGGGRGRPGMQGMFRPPNQQQQQQQQQQQNTGVVSKPKNTLKFVGDYDFEQANTEFEELRSQLAKTKITDDAPKVEVNGENEKKDDSGNETGAGDAEHDDDQQAANTTFYDKNKSFFDKISCEAVERLKGRSQRLDWRTERKLNSETFGWASARWGGYRGRGGFYNRGMYRGGGYRGNYRPQNQRLPSSNQQASAPAAPAAPAAAVATS